MLEQGRHSLLFLGIAHATTIPVVGDWAVQAFSLSAEGYPFFLNFYSKYLTFTLLDK